MGFNSAFKGLTYILMSFIEKYKSICYVEGTFVSFIVKPISN